MRNFNLSSCLLTIVVGLAATGVAQWALDDSPPMDAAIPVAIYAPTVSQLRQEVRHLRDTVREQEREAPRPVLANPIFDFTDR